VQREHEVDDPDEHGQLSVRQREVEPLAANVVPGNGVILFKIFPPN
jgi:hypothetical protein